MSLPNQLNDPALKAALNALPIDNRGLAPLASVKECSERHNKLKVVNRDVHPPVADLIFGNSLDKRWQHTASPYSPEQRGVWARALTLIKPVTAGPSTNDNPANDNEELGDAA